MEISNVEFLFENNTISEIEEIEKKLKKDVEKKTEDLKLIVGEKYRDLIEVSDSILSMRNHCDEIISSIERLSNYRTEFEKVKEIVEQPHYDDDIILSIKYQVILRTPSEIWSCLDKKDVIKAVYFYHQTKNVIDLSEKQLKCKKISKYKNFLKDFEKIIVKNCWENIQNIEDELNDVELAENLICILIMEEKTPKELLNLFLEKKNNIKSLFQSPQDFRKVLLDFFNILLTTCKLVYLVFYDDSGAKSLLTRKSYDIPKCKFTHSFLNKHLISKLKIQELNEFRVKCKNLQDIDKSLIQEACHKWISKLKNESDSEFFHKLGTVDSIRGIFAICFDIQNFLNTKNGFQWEDICECILGYDLSFWEHFLKNPIFSALDGLFNQKLYLAFELPIEDLINNGFEQNIINLVWGDDILNNHDLTKRSHGLTNKIIQVCHIFDENLSCLLSEINMINDKETFIDRLIPKNDLSHIKMCFVKAIEKHFILLLNKFDTFAEQVDNIESLLVLGQLSRGLMIECKNLAKCLDIVPDGMERWEKMNNYLKDYSTKAFLKFLANKLDSFANVFEERMRPTSLIHLAEIVLAWEEITLEDKTGDGKAIKSNIRIPYQISIPLFKLLNSITNTINDIAAHTISKQVINQFLIIFSKKVNEIYKSIFEDLKDFDDLPSSGRQTQALQIYYDLMFIQKFLSTSKEDSIKKEAASLNKTVTAYESLIDPFDLHLFFPYVQNSLSRASKSCSLLFSYFIEEVDSKSKSTPYKNEFHNLMNIVTLNTDFPLVQIKDERNNW